MDVISVSMERYVVFALSCLVSCLLHSQTRTAISDGNWNSAPRWSGNLIGGNPSPSTHDVVFNDNVDLVITNGSNYTIATLTVGKASSLSVNSGASLTITGDVNIDKEFTLNVAGNLNILGDLTIAKTLSLNVTGDLFVGGNMDLAKDAAMVVDGSMTVEGTANFNKDSSLLGAGSVTINGACASAAPNVCGDSQIGGLLPIVLLSIRVESINNESEVALNWITSTEINNDYFTIERTRDGQKFEELCRMSGAGNSNSMIHYTFIDSEPLPGLSYYRLTQTDFDGTSETFKLVKAEFYGNADAVSVYPNPVVDGKLRVMNRFDEPHTVEVYDMLGKQVAIHTIAYGETILNINGKTGLYFVTVRNGASTLISQQKIKVQ